MQVVRFFAARRLHHPAAPKKTARQFALAGSNPKDTLVNPLRTDSSGRLYE
jgi:hypothetical protein